MTIFVSYAQNFEDVILWRALKHIRNGFYIDVGANDPSLYSVTKAFYGRGWRGINIEPVKAFYEKLAAERPQDINLMVAAGEASGSITLYDTPFSGLATIDAEVAARNRAMGFDIRPQDVPVRRLDDICAEYAHYPIHFLKIDVEGAELAVLRGMDFDRWRPWIVLVEATRPLSQDESYHDWEPLLLGAGYKQVYADGLNRYYLAPGHDDLLRHFIYPPNVFDGFVKDVHYEAFLRAAEAEGRANDASRRAVELAERLGHAEKCEHQLRQQLLLGERAAGDLAAALARNDILQHALSDHVADIAAARARAEEAHRHLDEARTELSSAKRERDWLNQVHQVERLAAADERRHMLDSLLAEMQRRTEMLEARSRPFWPRSYSTIVDILGAPFAILRRLSLSRWIHRYILLQTARRAARVGNWQRAASRYRKLLSIKRVLPKVWVQFGHALKENGQWEEAADAYRQAQILDPSNTEIAIFLACLPGGAEVIGESTDLLNNNNSIVSNKESDNVDWASLSGSEKKIFMKSKFYLRRESLNK